MVRALLREAGLELTDLDGIAFGAGPGSFTGLRIACGVAQGLALGANLPRVGVVTLEAMAETARSRSGCTRVIAALTHACTRSTSPPMSTTERAGVCAARRAWSRPATRPCRPGEAGPASATALPPIRRCASAWPARWRSCDVDIVPAAVAIGALALPRFAAGEGVPARDAAPLYVRHRVALTSAERADGSAAVNATLARSVDAAAVLWRPLAESDIEAVAALEREAHAAPWTAGNFRDALAAGYGVAVGAVDGIVVAYGVLLFAPGEVQLLNLTVAPEARRLGIGRALLRRFLADARARGAEQCFLEVRVSNDGGDCAVCERGFRCRSAAAPPTIPPRRRSRAKTHW